MHYNVLCTIKSVILKGRQIYALLLVSMTRDSFKNNNKLQII